MAREKAYYRENLELLNQRYPAHDMLTMNQVMAVMGWGDIRTVRKRLAGHITPDLKVSKSLLASYMCGGSV